MAFILLGYLGRSCTCPSGYSGDGVGPNGCVTSGYGPCSSNPCGANGQCEVSKTCGISDCAKQVFLK